MKLLRTITLIVVIGTTPLFAQSQAADSTGKFGIAINSSFNGELYPIRLVPSITYLKHKSQFELGVGFHPFIVKDQRIYSAEFNYKFYPNGLETKYKTYLITRLSFVNNARDTYYNPKLNYLFLNAGYGFEVEPFKGAFMGTNVSAGMFTYGKSTDNPFPGQSNVAFGKEFGFNVAFQFSLGYRF